MPYDKIYLRKFFTLNYFLSFSERDFYGEDIFFSLASNYHMRFIISLFVNGLLVFLASALLSGVYVDGFLIAIIAGAVLGFVNFFIKPLITLLTIPITILTLGLFMIIINGAMVLVADFLVPGFEVEGLGWAILFSFVLAIFNVILGRYEVNRREQ